MTPIDSFTPTSFVTRRVILTFAGLVITVGALCVLFLSMRSVMDIGGVCASGNTPYTPRVPCPEGVSGLLIGSVFAGLIGLGVYAVSTFRFNFTLLAWPALFISLGYNFFDYGVSPPPDFGEGPVWGWIVCGVVFVLMGGVPLLVWIAAVLGKRESRITKIDTQQSLRDRLRMSTGGQPVEDPQTREQKMRTLAIAVHVLGVIGGIWGGMELFEWVTGSKVKFGFR